MVGIYIISPTSFTYSILEQLVVEKRAQASSGRRRSDDVKRVVGVRYRSNKQILGDNMNKRED